MDTRDNFEQNTQVLEVTENAKKYLKSTASWSLFFAVLGFIGVAILVICGIAVMLMGDFFGVDLGYMSFFGIFYIALGIVMVFPALYLLSFSQKTKKALVDQDTMVMEEAFKNMKSYWKFTGIMAIVIISLYFVVFLAAFILGDLMR